MKNIITVLDSNHWSPGAINLGCYLAGLSHSRLTGVFPEMPADEQAVIAGETDWIYPVIAPNKQIAQSVDGAIKRFRKVCSLQEVCCDVHRTGADPLSDLVTESLYADLLIVDEAVSFSETDGKIPTKLITALQTSAKCPVIIASTSFDVIKEIIFAYDGTYSSIFAIKQFTYLFPELKDRKILVVELAGHGATDSLTRLGYWLEDNYTDIAYESLEGDAEDRLFEIVMSKQKAMLVMGASRRNALSSFFIPGPAKAIIKFANNPIFIAHH